ncbi:hypothetical protein KMW28_12645 [Flammeovirga yaeyamensis]|uniref:Uncharacterized protein n=1 Tax=Flammeovirga yaeyamensis TaxID=367791 RepID=A0AAX1MZD8_9BACT|nr:hypothetical protein [Flammeovirga yaeyamensis]MBB3695983.1 hypothetical protein [Flammeovirga yaeyamensis]NMF34669.1 hypothetical protein [Flammeovirga yaeyamensis]QWG00501.1 hypothetical protein KMW28_12645 [Flammeovirga yaeyamensis]
MLFRTLFRKFLNTQLKRESQSVKELIHDQFIEEKVILERREINHLCEKTKLVLLNISDSLQNTVKKDIELKQKRSKNYKWYVKLEEKIERHREYIEVSQEKIDSANSSVDELQYEIGEIEDQLSNDEYLTENEIYKKNCTIERRQGKIEKIENFIEKQNYNITNNENIIYECQEKIEDLESKNDIKEIISLYDRKNNYTIEEDIVTVLDTFNHDFYNKSLEEKLIKLYNDIAIEKLFVKQLEHLYDLRYSENQLLREFKSIKNEIIDDNKISLEYLNDYLMNKDGERQKVHHKNLHYIVTKEMEADDYQFQAKQLKQLYENGSEQKEFLDKIKIEIQQSASNLKLLKKRIEHIKKNKSKTKIQESFKVLSKYFIYEMVFKNEYEKEKLDKEESIYKNLFNERDSLQKLLEELKPILNELNEKRNEFKLTKNPVKAIKTFFKQNNLHLEEKEIIKKLNKVEHKKYDLEDKKYSVNKKIGQYEDRLENYRIIKQQFPNEEVKTNQALYKKLGVLFNIEVKVESFMNYDEIIHG